MGPPATAPRGVSTLFVSSKMESWLSAISWSVCPAVSSRHSVRDRTGGDDDAGAAADPATVLLEHHLDRWGEDALDHLLARWRPQPVGGAAGADRDEGHERESLDPPESRDVPHGG